jgi:hypothetical protein
MAYIHPMAPGGNPGTSPLPGGNAFQNFLNMGIDAKALQEMLSKGKGKAAGLAGKYGPVVSKGVTRGAPLVGAGLSLLQGDVGGAVGAGLGGVLGSALGPVGAVGGSMLGGMLGSAAQSGIAGLVSGGQQSQRERGESATRTGLGEGKSVGDMKPEEVIDFMRKAGMSQVEIAQALNPQMNQNLDRQMQRQMQLNQQLGQLTGALNQQKYMAQLAGGAQQEAGATTRQMITSQNPYAASVFQYGG